MHNPLRLASAEPATVTVPAAYEGAAMTTDCNLDRAGTSSDRDVRFGAYVGSVMTANGAASTRAIGRPREYRQDVDGVLAVGR